MYTSARDFQQQNLQTIDFPTDIASIKARIEAIDPKKYGTTRNYKDGALTYLSPYISREVISTKQVAEHIFSLGLPKTVIEKLIQELAWRDYWQLVWRAKGEAISTDLKHPQSDVSNYQIPKNIVNATTGIKAIDEGISELYETGYMHNHMRMYVASLATNIGKSHWLEPARWMYYHLLDGDWASNALSWQWVAGSFSNKKYIANQENINKYFNTQQKGTFLDVSYEKLAQLELPNELKLSEKLELNTELSVVDSGIKKPLNKNTFLYTYYNLDPDWHAGEAGDRILILEPSFFERYPVSQVCLDFALKLAKNIPDIKIFVGEIDNFLTELNPENIFYKEHPAFRWEIKGEEPRDWMTSIEGFHSSFFSYWKKAQKELFA